MEFSSRKYVKLMLVLVPEDKDKCAQETWDKTREEIIETQIMAVDKILKLCAPNATHRVSRIIANMVNENHSVQETIPPKTSKTTNREIQLYKTKSLL